MKQSVKIGEEVVVISGSAKGKRGKVLAVMPSESRVIVEGVNIRKFHERKSQKNPDGAIVEREASIHISNLNPVDKNNKPSRIGRKLVDGKLVRYAKTTGEELK